MKFDTGSKVFLGASIVAGASADSLRSLSSGNGANAQAEARIKKCLKSHDPINYVKASNAVQARIDVATATLIPVFTPSLVPAPWGNKVITNAAALELASIGITDPPQENFQWFSPVIPSVFDENRQCQSLADSSGKVPPVFPFGPLLPICPLPPARYPDVSYDPADMFPPFIHQSPDATKWGYKKFGSVPACVAPLIGTPIEDFRSDGPFTTVFHQNLEHRGIDNLRKKQYMSALTCDKLPFYEDLLETKLLQFVDDVADAGPTVPFASTWINRIEELYLDIHFGAVEHPGYVKRYYRRAFEVIATLRWGCPTEQVQYESYCDSLEVTKYVQDRIDAIIVEEDKSTFVYWWNKAGMPPQSIIQEAIHNSLAFNQFLSSPYLVIAAKLFGRISISSLATGLDPLKHTTINFFAKYSEATTPEEKLDVNRETWRLLLPNNAWFSSLHDEAGQNDDILVTDENFVFNTAVHSPFFIQAFNDGYNPANGATTAYEFSTDRYANLGHSPDAAAAAKCPFLQAEDETSASVDEDDLLTPDDLEASFVDGETVMPRGHEEIIPVYETMKYCPFGSGYRRCPAEAFNYLFMDKVLSIFGKRLEFSFAEPAVSIEELSAGVACDTKGAVPGGIVCRRDSILASVVN